MTNQEIYFSIAAEGLNKSYFLFLIPIGIIGNTLSFLVRTEIYTFTFSLKWSAFLLLRLMYSDFRFSWFKKPNPLGHNHTERQAERQAVRQGARSHWNALWSSKIGPRPIPKHYVERHNVTL